MQRHVLITGGAGFIGSHLADELLRHGHRVRALDNLWAQVHGPDARRPAYLPKDVELIVGDVRDRDVVRRALRGVDAVFHFAAAVGVGQSMYAVEEYIDVNERGTAVLGEALIERPVERLVVASSMSVYGEGLYRTATGKSVPGTLRGMEQLEARCWEALDDTGEPLAPVPTPESKLPDLASIYALSKYGQERMCLILGQAYGIPTIALRFFNVYGPRQALSNPYTGVLAIFASRLLNDHSPVVFEDGQQRRDFVHVRDVARACRLAMEAEGAAYRAINVGSGTGRTVLEIAQRMSVALGKQHIEPQVTGRYRKGDIRHCFADVSLARSLLGYSPQIDLAEGLPELAQWVAGQWAEDRVERAGSELSERGLLV